MFFCRRRVEHRLGLGYRARAFCQFDQPRGQLGLVPQLQGFHKSPNVANAVTSVMVLTDRWRAFYRCLTRDGATDLAHVCQTPWRKQSPFRVMARI